MKKFFETGNAFLAVALICAVSGVIGNPVFIAIAAVWLIIGLAARNKYAKKTASGDKS